MYGQRQQSQKKGRVIGALRAREQLVRRLQLAGVAGRLTRHGQDRRGAVGMARGTVHQLSACGIDGVTSREDRADAVAQPVRAAAQTGEEEDQLVQPRLAAIGLACAPVRLDDETGRHGRLQHDVVGIAIGRQRQLDAQQLSDGSRRGRRDQPQRTFLGAQDAEARLGCGAIAQRVGRPAKAAAQAEQVAVGRDLAPAECLQAIGEVEHPFALLVEDDRVLIRQLVGRHYPAQAARRRFARGDLQMADLVAVDGQRDAIGFSRLGEQAARARQGEDAECAGLGRAPASAAALAQQVVDRGTAAGLVARDGGQRQRGQRRRLERAAEEAAVALPKGRAAIRGYLAQQQPEKGLRHRRLTCLVRGEGGHRQRGGTQRLATTEHRAQARPVDLALLREGPEQERLFGVAGSPVELARGASGARESGRQHRHQSACPAELKREQAISGHHRVGLSVGPPAPASVRALHVVHPRQPGLGNRQETTA